MTRKGTRADARGRRAKHTAALDRPELLLPSEPRRSAAGPTSMAVKTDPTRALVDAAIARMPPGCRNMGPVAKGGACRRCGAQQTEPCQWEKNR